MLEPFTPNDRYPAAPFIFDVDILGWDKLYDWYSPGYTPKPLKRIIEIAQGHMVKSVVIERRYADPDWRRQHAVFFGGIGHGRYPNITHRLHFFTVPVASELDLRKPKVAAAYVGYSVMRPIPSNPVGRTMIRPPDIDGAAFCLATDEVHPFGQTLRIAAMPFMSQDGEYLRCAHADQWMVAYHAHLVHGLARRLPDEIHQHSLTGHIRGRQMPSAGLTFSQILTGLHGLGMAPEKMTLPFTDQAYSHSKGVLSLPASLCRYINSQVPPIVVSDRHTWVAVGYGHQGPPLHNTTVLYVHDDADGPYQPRDPWEGPPWKYAVAGLPQRLYLLAHHAELIGRDILLTTKTNDHILQNLYTADMLPLRTYAIRANDYKAGVTGRLPAVLARLFRRATWPGYIWICEALDRERMNAGEPAVLGEVVIDSSTLHVFQHEEYSPWSGVLALHLEEHAACWDVGVGNRQLPPLKSRAPYISGCPIARW